MKASSKQRTYLALVFIMVFLSTLSYSQTSDSREREVRADLQRAQEALKVNDPDSAIREYRAALELDPKNIDARANLGVISFMQGQFADAAGNFRQVVKLD